MYFEVEFNQNIKFPIGMNTRDIAPESMSEVDGYNVQRVSSTILRTCDQQVKFTFLKQEGRA